jgi:hypothetical protein
MYSRNAKKILSLLYHMILLKRQILIIYDNTRKYVILINSIVMFIYYMNICIYYLIYTLLYGHNSYIPLMSPDRNSYVI